MWRAFPIDWINNYPFYVRYTELVIRLVNKTLNTVLTSIVLFLKLSPLGLESKSSGLGLALEPRRRVLAPGQPLRPLEDGGPRGLAPPDPRRDRGDGRGSRRLLSRW